MADPPLRTTQLHRWLDRMHAGDLTAREELLRHVGDRLERLARKMRRKFPGGAEFEETGDLVQKAGMRLLRALETERPESVKGFFGLAAEQMRRELLDLGRHYRALKRQAPPLHPVAHANEDPQLEDVPEQADDPSDLEQWCAFHEAVERLSAEQREVVGLVFYHDWTQAEVAELFQVDVRTVRRWWQAALLKLHTALREADSAS